MSDLYKYFRIESAELIEGLTQGVLGLEKGAPTQETIAVMLRLAHTLKGAARVVKLAEIADQAHTLEEQLTPFRQSSQPVAAHVLTQTLAIVDGISEQVRQIDAPRSTTSDTPVDDILPVEMIRTVRTDVAEMDSLLGGIRESHAQVGALRNSISLTERTRKLLETVAIEEPGSVRALSTMNEVRNTVISLERLLHTSIEHIDRELRQVRETAEQLRLVPASTLFTDLERAVRDVAQAQSKTVAFVGRGGAIRIDSHVISLAQAALHQLVRNAVVHGLEDQNTRARAGKPPEGTVTLQVLRRGSRVAFICRDDGRGVDLRAVQSSAQHIEDLSDKRLTDVLLKSGFTTSKTVTELSGRGIGLDVVRDAAVRLNGEVTITTEAGVGTSIELTVPLSLAALEALTVEVDGEMATIPIDAIRQTVRITSDEIASGPAGDTLSLDGEALPFMALRTAVSNRAAVPQTKRTWSAVILDTESGSAAIGVDRLAGTPTIAVRPLPSLTPSAPLVSGAWIDGEGTAQSVLDPDGLVRSALQPRTRHSYDDAPVPPILVVDDSLTTRMLEQSILESAGHKVELASSAEEALVRLANSHYALVLVDVEMPGMDGFGFIEHVNADVALRDTPCILVTSRASADDLRRGDEVGAYAYIAKGEFNQQELLSHIHDIMVKR